MNDGYNKLFGSIVTSTIWQEPHTTRIVWITLLALADKNGEVQGAVPGLANIANVTIDEFQRAMKTLMAPDQYSRTTENEGRRLEVIDGGWRLFNHGKYRAILSKQAVRASKAAYMARSRAEEKEKKQQESTVDNEIHNGQPKQRQRQRQKQEKKKPPVVPLQGDGVAAAPKVPRGAAITFTAFLEGLGDAKAITKDDPVREYAKNAGIPPSYLRLAWYVFRAYHKDRPDKRQIDWRAVFRNYVRENYLKLWHPTPEGYELTAKGEQASRAMAAEKGDQA